MNQPSLCILTTAYPSFSSQNIRIPRGKFVHDAAKSFVAKGFRVHVVTHREKEDPAYELVDGVAIHRFHYFLPGFESLTSGSGIPENIKKIGGRIQVPFYFFALFWNGLVTILTHRIQFINAHWVFPSGFVGFVLKLITRRKLILTAYGAEVFPLEKGRMLYLKTPLRVATRSADVVAAISAATADSLGRIAGTDKIRVIPDGIDTVYYHPGTRDLSLLDRYGLSNKRVIFFTGRMVERKGHRILLEAMKKVAEKYPTAVLVLGGDGPLYNEIEALRKEWKLVEKVLLPGPIPEKDIVAWMQTCDVFVLPSCVDSNGDTEGSATIALEAMACGTVSLVSEVGGNKRAISDGEGAFYFQPSNPRDLAEKIARFLDLSPEDLVQQRKKARLFVDQNYRWDIICDKYRNAIQESLEERKCA